MSSNFKTAPVRSLEEEKTAIQIVTEMLDKKITELCREQGEAFAHLAEKVREVENNPNRELERHVPARLYLHEIKRAYRRLVYTEGRIEKLSGISNELDTFRRER